MRKSEQEWKQSSMKHDRRQAAHVQWGGIAVGQPEGSTGIIVMWKKKGMPLAWWCVDPQWQTYGMTWTRVSEDRKTQNGLHFTWQERAPNP